MSALKIAPALGMTAGFVEAFESYALLKGGCLEVLQLYHPKMTLKAGQSVEFLTGIEVRWELNQPNRRACIYLGSLGLWPPVNMIEFFMRPDPDAPEVMIFSEDFSTNVNSSMHIFREIGQLLASYAYGWVCEAHNGSEGTLRLSAQLLSDDRRF